MRGSHVIVGVAALAALGVLAYRGGGMAALHTHAAEINGPLVFGLLLVLPLLGFPVSVLHVAAGIRFGVGVGLALVAVSIVAQLLASYWLVYIQRERFERWSWLQQLRERIPTGSHTAITLFTVLLPGAPYTAINYVLPLLGVPLRILLAVALPVHVIRSTITVMLGDQSDELTPARLAVLVLYALAILLASWVMYRRLRSQLGDRPPAAGDRKRPA